MAITTFPELQTAIANWLDRTDLAERIPEFIALGEATIRRKLRTMGEEKRATAETVAGNNTIALPADFNGMREVHIQGDPITALSPVTPGKLRSSRAGSESGTPIMFAVSDDVILFGPTPDTVYTVEMTYYAFDPLTDSNPTNAVLTSHPDLYLYLALVEGFRYLNDDQRELKMLTHAQVVLNAIVEADEAKRWGAQPLQTRTA